MKRILALAAGAAVLVLAPSAASAQVGWGGTLTPGSVACVGQHATTQVRGDGTATDGGAKFFMYKNGAQIYTTGGRVQGWAKEFKANTYPPFPGEDDYTVCAKNTGSANTLVNFYILSDGEF